MGLDTQTWVPFISKISGVIHAVSKITISQEFLIKLASAVRRELSQIGELSK